MTLLEHPRTLGREERRQRAVDSLAVAAGSENPTLDRITRLARSVLGMSASTITVLDHDRAWFPSSTDTSLSLVPRDQTFCDHTTEVDETVLVTDARHDERFSGLEAVRAGDVLAYAGHPLHDPWGNVVATFCVFSADPRTLDEREVAILLDLAAWAEHELTSAGEMEQVREAQVSLLPARPLSYRGWQVAGLCLPSLAVGGDLYDFGLHRDVLQVGLGDVMGKGTGAALLGAGVRSAVRSTSDAVASGADLGTTTTRVGRQLRQDLHRAESFATLFQLAISIDDGAARYVDAGSGLALLVRADGTTERLRSDDRPLGVLDDDSWSEHRTSIGPGDRLLLFSDGLLDLLAEDGDWWAEISGLVRAAADVEDLMTAITRLTRLTTPLDDVTAVAVFRSA